MANPYLLLWLEAPLQAGGHDAKVGRRDSLDFPTKSGVLGLLCCALLLGPICADFHDIVICSHHLRIIV